MLLLSYLRPKWEVLQGIGLLDVLVIPIAFGIMLYFVIALFFRYSNTNWKHYLLPAYFSSILFGMAFAAIYNYYYQGGDTFWYYDYSRFFRWAFDDNPITGVRLFLAPPGADNPEFIQYMAPMGHLYYLRQDNEMIFMFKIIGLIEAILVPSYWLTTLVFAAFAFSGKWVFFKFLAKKYPLVTKQLAIAILFIPSVLFWGTGILKDTICLGSLCWLMVHFWKLIDNPKRNLYRIIWIAIFFKIIVTLKAYLVLALIGPAALYVYNTHKPNFNINLIKYLSLPLVLAVFVVSSGAILSNIASTSQKYQLDQLEKRAEGFKSYHTYLAKTQGQSFYSLGDVSYTPIGIISKIPAAFNVTYFRPYPWEVNEPLQFLSAFESIILFSIFIYLVYRMGLITLIRSIKNDKIASMLLLYSFILGISIGLTAYNFGALVRFKIPGVLALATTFAILFNHLLAKRTANKL